MYRQVEKAMREQRVSVKERLQQQHTEPSEKVQTGTTVAHAAKKKAERSHQQSVSTQTGKQPILQQMTTEESRLEDITKDLANIIKEVSSISSRLIKLAIKRRLRRIPKLPTAVINTERLKTD